MTTRLYYENDTLDIQTGRIHQPLQTFTPDAAWGVTTGFVRRWLTKNKLVSPLDNTTFTETSATAVNRLCVQFVSLGRLAAQTITGTVKGQIRWSETATDADFDAQLVIRVIAPDGTVRGTLLAAHSSALSSEFVTADTNRKVPLAALSPVTLSSVVCQDGDLLVVEVGYRAYNTTTTSKGGRISWGSNGSGDYAEDETSTSGTLNPWLEFSSNLSFLDELEVTQIAVEASYGPDDDATRHLITQVAVEGSYYNDEGWWELGTGVQPWS
jgi:hypothetical protein